MPLSSFAYHLQVIIFAYTCGQSLSPSAFFPDPPSLTPFPARSRWSSPAWDNSWLDVGGGAAELEGWGGGGEWGRGLFLSGPWRRTVSEHTPLRFRRGRKGLGSGKEALQAAPTASALHLLHPPSSPHWFLRQVQHAETPSPSVPCSFSSGLEAALPAGSCSSSLLLGLGSDGRETGHVRVGGKAVSGEQDLL